VVVLALLIAGAVALGTRGGSAAPGPHFLRDAFNYKPAPGFGYIGGPQGFAAAELAGVSAASSNDAWIVGSAPCCSTGNTTPRSLAWHWYGTAWRSFPMPRPRLADPALASVATIDSGDAWAVGSARTYTVSPSGRQWPGPFEALAEHWNGSQWRVVHVPGLGERSSLSAVSAAGSRNVWAIGYTYGSVRLVHHRRLRPTQPVLLHWNGRTWRHVSLPWARPDVRLGKVVAVGRDSVWLTQSFSESGVDKPNAGTVEFWDGSRWTEIPAPFGRNDPPSGFTATSGSDAWAVGSYERLRGSGFSSAIAAHWNGSEWQVVPVPKLPGAANYIQANDVAAAGPDDVWLSSFNWLANGKHGRNNVALLEHWDGRSWHITSGTPPPVAGATPSFRVGVAADGTAWAVEANECDNVVLRWSGHGWKVTRHPADRYIFSVPRSMQSRIRRELACTPSGGYPRPGPTGSSGPTG